MYQPIQIKLLATYFVFIFSSTKILAQIESNDISQKIGFDKQYQIISKRAYILTEPNANSKKKAYLIFGDIITPLKEQGGCFYIEYKNSVNHITKGWILGNQARVNSSTNNYISQNNDDVSQSTITPYHFLTLADLLVILRDQFQTKERISKILMQLNSSLTFNEIDPNSGEMFYKTDGIQEMLDWHYKVRVLEYVFSDKANYRAIISGLKKRELNVVKTSTDGYGNIISTYSDGKIVAQLTPVKLSTGITYKIFLGVKN